MTTPADVIDFEARGLVERATRIAQDIADAGSSVANRLNQSADPTPYVKQIAQLSSELTDTMAEIRAKYAAIRVIKGEKAVSP